MPPVMQYVIYAGAFIGVILLIEAVYLLMRNLFGSEQAMNTRLKLMRDAETPEAALTILREKRTDPISSMLVDMVPDFDRMLWQANIALRPSALFGVMVVLALLLAVVIRVMFLVPLMWSAVLGIGIGFGLPYLAVTVMAGLRRKKFLEQLPMALDLIARGLQAGHPVATAFQMVAKEMPDPIGTEFGLTTDEMNFGLDRYQALHNLSRRFPSPELQLFVTATIIQKETGGNMVEILGNLATTIRSRHAMLKKIMALTAEGRISMIIVVALPFVVGGAILMINPRYYMDVVDDPLFVPMLLPPIILQIIGVFWIWKMVSMKP